MDGCWRDGDEARRRSAASKGARVTVVLRPLPYSSFMYSHREPGIRHLTYDQLVATSADHECEGVGRDHICVRIAAVADLPTKFGTFHIVGFWNDRDGKDHIGIVKGDPFGKSDVPVRMHSECLTGDALGSLRCDCRDQLTSALQAIGCVGGGLFVANVDDTDALVDATVVDAHHVPTREREHALDAGSLQCRGNEPPPVCHEGHVTI